MSELQNTCKRDFCDTIILVREAQLKSSGFSTHTGVAMLSLAKSTIEGREKQLAELQVLALPLEMTSDSRCGLVLLLLLALALALPFLDWPSNSVSVSELTTARGDFRLLPFLESPLRITVSRFSRRFWCCF